MQKSEVQNTVNWNRVVPVFISSDNAPIAAILTVYRDISAALTRALLLNLRDRIQVFNQTVWKSIYTE